VPKYDLKQTINAYSLDRGTLRHDMSTPMLTISMLNMMVLTVMIQSHIKEDKASEG
jgi:hypothetical protein